MILENLCEVNIQIDEALDATTWRRKKLRFKSAHVMHHYGRHENCRRSLHQLSFLMACHHPAVNKRRQEHITASYPVASVDHPSEADDTRRRWIVDRRQFRYNHHSKRAQEWG